ncbi:uncharacterized protein BKA78DRAFT_119796 [Phyllosticta capitalensis]|uniref:uncharacterized protein n=1 Tax=Phyllosticta capitalensis TaxID=121624 RepID=UPI003131CA67
MLPTPQASGPTHETLRELRFSLAVCDVRNPSKFHAIIRGRHGAWWAVSAKDPRIDGTKGRDSEQHMRTIVQNFLLPNSTLFLGPTHARKMRFQGTIRSGDAGETSTSWQSFTPHRNHQAALPCFKEIRESASNAGLWMALADLGIGPLCHCFGELRCPVTSSQLYIHWLSRKGRGVQKVVA